MSDSANIGKNNLPKVDLFQSKTWQNNQLSQDMDAALKVQESSKTSGKWTSAYKPKDLEAYYKTLKGVERKSYDPKGYFKELGLPDCFNIPGRGDTEMFKASQKYDYTPDPSYIPAPAKIAGAFQKTVLAVGSVFPGFVKGLDKAIDKTVLKKMEKPDLVDPNPFGREEDIQKGSKSDLSINHRYAGIASQDSSQYTWAEGVHSGSPLTTPNRSDENFGTYDIALKLGFSEEQASRIAASNNAVDTNTTHYQQNGSARITQAGSGGDKGDLFRHFNRSAAGQEDTRITAAKVHMERAQKFAKEGYYDAAEEELGIGLHSLQDMFAHAQITPFNHSLLGEFPDIVKANPVGMYEAAVATEAYLKKFATDLGVENTSTTVSQTATGEHLLANEPSPFAEAKNREKWPLVQKLVTGDASKEQQLLIGKQLAEYPKELLTLLVNNKVNIFLGASATNPLQVGFGKDLDGDGKASTSTWVDVNQDGTKQAFEEENMTSDGRDWASVKAAYNEQTKTVFISSNALSSGDTALKHEITHAVDGIFSNDPSLKDKWQGYREHLFELGRREGDVSFSETNSKEFLAQ